jgi:hypothetical protein
MPVNPDDVVTISEERLMNNILIQTKKGDEEMVKESQSNCISLPPVWFLRSTIFCLATLTRSANDPCLANPTINA